MSNFVENFKEKETHVDEVLTTEEILSQSSNGISIKCFRTIFPNLNSDRKNSLADINRYLSKFDEIEIITIAQVMMEYREYFNVNHHKNLRYPDLFKATKFVLDIQGGMSKLESYLKSHYYLDKVQEYEELREKDTKEARRLLSSLATASSAYGNSSLVLTLAQALDAPIQISYQGYKNQMIEVLREIATDKKATPKTRMEAANNLLNQLNPNNISTLQINLGKEEKQSFINDTRTALKLLAEKKLELFKTTDMDKAEIINVDIIKEANEVVKEEFKKDEFEDMEKLLQLKEDTDGKSN